MRSIKLKAYCRNCSQWKWCGKDHCREKLGIVETPKEVMPHTGRDPELDKTDPPSLGAGDVCPTCHRKMPLSNAERQRRFRERKKET